MKKYVILCMTLFMLFTLSSCGNHDQKPTDKAVRKAMNQNGDFQIGLSIANTKDGSYMLAKTKEDYQILYFYDTRADKLVPLCQKANCEHKDMSCHAYQLAQIRNKGEVYMASSLVFYHERLYIAYFGITAASPILIKSIKKDGSDLREEYRSSYLGTLNLFAMYKNKFLISNGFLAKDATGRYTGSSTINAIQEYDLDTKKEKILVNKEQKENRMVYTIGMDEQKMFYLDLAMNTNINKISTYDMESNQTNQVAEIENFTSIIYKGYVYQEDGKNIMRYNIESKKRERFITGKQKIEFLNISSQGYLTYNEMLENADTFTHIIDLNTKKEVLKEPIKNAYVIGRNEDYYFIQDEKNEIYKYDEHTHTLTSLMK